MTTALKSFLTHGYEGTSVRMILKEANVVTGSFYHFFKSKEDLFEETISRFMDMHVAQIATASTDDSIPFLKQLELILEIVGQNSRLYIEKLQANQLHWTVQVALLERTLLSIIPHVEIMIRKALENGTARNVIGLDFHTLSIIILQGIKGIIHATPIEKIDNARIIQIKKDVISYVAYVLDLDLSSNHSTNMP